MMRWSGIALTSFAIYCGGMVTGAQIFIENRSIRTMKCVLFSVSMTIMINLKKIEVEMFKKFVMKT